jgi:ssDNA-specific exonuclease RecJ
MNINTQTVKQLSEKAREGRRRRQRERRRRQRQQELCNNEYDYDEFCERSKFIIIDPKFTFLKKVDSCELHTKLAQIYSEHNTSVPSNLKTYAFNKKFKKLDEFIAQTPPTDNINDFQISGGDLCYGKKIYNTMKDDPNPEL